MVTLTPKNVVAPAMAGACQTHARTTISVRDVQVTIDEPEARGGTNQGSTPTEPLIAALVGCTTVIAHRVAEVAGVGIAAMSIAAEADFDRRGVRLEEKIEVPFPKVTLTIDLTTAAGDGGLARLKSDLGKCCPLTKVIKNSGSELTVQWNMARP